MGKIIFYDLETGGTNPYKHPVIQFAAIACIEVSSLGPFRAVDELEVKVDFNVSQADPEALEVNSYDPETWKREAVTQATAWKMISGFLRNHSTMEKVSKRGNPYHVAKLAAWNGPTFDKPFLWEMGRGEFVPADYRVWDPMQLAMWKMDIPSYKLTEVAKALGITFNEDDQHDALGDVKAMIEVTRRLV